MEAITELVQAVLHLDATLGRVAAEYGPWLYVLLFLVIFAETGLVVTPFLPGDSLLFVAGTVVAGTAGALSVHLLVALLIVAAILGDSVNYSIGRWIGPKVFEHDHRYIRREHLQKTQAFYDRYGAVTIIIGRFVPIVRTFAPFLAGVAGMRYRLPVRQHPVGEEQPDADRGGDRRGLADSRGDHVHAGAPPRPRRGQALASSGVRRPPGVRRGARGRRPGRRRWPA